MSSALLVRKLYWWSTHLNERNCCDQSKVILKVARMVKVLASQPPSKYLLVLKMSSRSLQDMSWERLQHVSSATILSLPRRVEDVLKTSWRYLTRRLQDVFKTLWKTKNCYTGDVFETCLEDVLKTCIEDVLKTFPEDVLKTCLDDVLKILWRQTK